jgi:hypothetical protein
VAAQTALAAKAASPFTVHDIAQARAAVEVAQAALQAAASTASDARVVAPAAGTVSDVPVAVGSLVSPQNPIATIIASEEASAFEPLVRAGKVSGIIDPDRRGELLGAQLITAVDYLRCQRLRTEICRDIVALFSRYDIILGSTTLQCAPPIDADLGAVFAGGNTIEAAENLVGLPAISVPCGFNKRKLPIGLKIIGKPFDEASVLGLAHVYQSVTDWHTKRPRL